MAAKGRKSNFISKPSDLIRKFEAAGAVPGISAIFFSGGSSQQACAFFTLPAPLFPRTVFDITQLRGEQSQNLPPARVYKKEGVEYKRKKSSWKSQQNFSVMS
ncbi:hypothetical protein TNIN_67711 [Trichonephila inaurata madagascariensis]|uniref:Uncharacterized protein n=1 Tax=Trichonephila inaurata madagascariensis TaxID=2747483 RepID=A0A8X6MD13_9ARAC|nr:hypothetical protein TNIN_67711 [Trichonephila inaurata madagascariensis]